MRVYLYLFLGMATFGSATPISKLVTDRYPVFVAATIRVLLGAAVLAPFALRRGLKLREIRRRDWGVIGLIALLGMFGFTVLMLYGMKMVSGVVGSIVMSTAPAVTATLAILFMNERATWRKLIALALAVTGVVLLRLTSGGISSAEEFSLLGVVMVFAAVCCEAGYTLFGRLATRNLDPLVLAFLGAALSLPLFLPFALWQGRRWEWSAPSPTDWGALVWYGAGTLALGSALWYSGVERAEGSIAAGFMGVMPVSALVLSYVLLGESFRWAHLLGFAIVFGGVVLMSWEHARMAERQPAEESDP